MYVALDMGQSIWCTFYKQLIHQYFFWIKYNKEHLWQDKWYSIHLADLPFMFEVKKKKLSYPKWHAFAYVGLYVFKAVRRGEAIHHRLVA